MVVAHVIHGYVRTSTVDQTLEQQLAAIKAAYPADTKYEIYHEQISAWSGQRPEYELLKKLIGRGNVKEVACFSVSRLGRNVQEACRFLELCQKHNVKVRVIAEGLDFSGPMGFALWSLFSALAQMESDTKSAAIKAKFKLKRERDGWKCHGSPPHCLAAKVIAKAGEVYRMLDDGRGYRYIAAMLGISEHSVGKLVKLRGYPLITREQFAELFPGWQNLPKNKLPTLDALRNAYVARYGPISA